MQRDINRLESTEFDLLVIGGGVSGGAIAWDAALRGHSTAIIEKKDWGHGTSAATSKLIHGGLRYLAQFDIRLVRESLRERRLLEQNAAHQAFPLPFLLPIYKYTPTKRWMLGAGLTLYDLLSFDKNDLRDPDKHLSNHKWLKKERALELEPGLDPEGLKGAYLYYDVLNKHPERSNLDYVLSAADKGAQAANYVECRGFLRDENGHVKGVKALDHKSGREIEIHSKITLNATGPWGDLVLNSLEDKPVRKIIRSKGIHILTPRIHKDTAITFETRDKHHFFIIPWLNYTLIGTTDTAFNKDPDDLTVTRRDVTEFMKLINDHYPGRLDLDSVIHQYAGIRPLVAESDVDTTYETSRKHEVIDHLKAENIDGLFSVFGGKWTTSRALAEETVNRLEKRFKLPRRKCKTRTTPLVAGRVGDRLSAYIETAVENSRSYADPQLVRHLIEYYGSEYNRVLNYAKNDQNLMKPLVEGRDHIKAEAVHAVENEMCLTLEDFMMRRCGLGNTGYDESKGLEAIAAELGSHLNWSSSEQKEQIDNYLKAIALTDE